MKSYITFAIVAAGAAGVFPNQDTTEEDKITQTASTHNNGQGTFTVQLGPKSDVGVYDRD